MEHWNSEKQLVLELERLRRQVKRLHNDIRGGAIPLRPDNAGPVLPTEPERKLRRLTTDPDDSSTPDE